MKPGMGPLDTCLDLSSIIMMGEGEEFDYYYRMKKSIC